MRSPHSTRKTLALTFALLAATVAVAVPSAMHLAHLRSDVHAGKQADGTTLVVTDQLLRPWSPETYIKGRPVDMAFNGDRSLLAILNSRAMDVVDERTGELTSFHTDVTSYCGIAFRPGTDELWGSEGSRSGHSAVAIVNVRAKGEAHPERVVLGRDSLPAGIAFSADGKTAYVALNGSNTVAVINAATRKVEREIAVSLAPLFVKLSADGNTLYVSNRGGHPPAAGVQIGYSAGVPMATDASGAVLNGTVSIVDLKSGKVVEKEVGRAPSSLALSPDGRTLAVANSHSDSVSLLDTATLAVQTIPVPTMPDHLLGTVPSSVLFSPDGRWLYVAAALNNAVIVMERHNKSYEVAGAIPTGWFPGALAFDGHNQLAVLNIKGRGNTVAATTTAAPAGASVEGAHNTHSFEGSLMRLPVLDHAQLKAATQLVIEANNPKFDSQGGVADLGTLGIKHVILIVKENRTYDQVMGDMGKGNGEPKFTLFGKDVTPNEHALANKYVLLDNFYATGAISFDGHQWLEQGFVSDNMERSSSGPRGYAWNLSDALDVSPAGFIWEHPQRPLEVRVAGVLSQLTDTSREQAKGREQDIDAAKPTEWQRTWDLYTSGKWHGVFGSKPAVPALASIIDKDYPGNSTALTDQIRASVFEEKIAAADKAGHLPDLMVYALPSDHTMGTTPGAPRPQSMVADNDYALGRIVAAVSHSRFWPETLILVVEDDAQNGTDHVDGHRTVALAIGPMVKRNAVDSNFYTQLSMARTVQDILHVDPQTHFLKTARAMNSIFTPQKDNSPYVAIKPRIKIDDINPPLRALSGQARLDALASSRMDWKEIDDVPSQVLNRIVWASVKGYEIPMPPPRKSLPDDAH